MITYNQRRIQGPLGEAPIVVSCGIGTDSIALLVELHKRAIRPDLILFTVGNEQNHTYDYIPIPKRHVNRGQKSQRLIVT